MLPTLIIDFDSTLVTVEALEELANIALSNNAEKENILKRIAKITQQGMNGEIPFRESLERRLTLFKANKHILQETIHRIMSSITPSVLRNKNFFIENDNRIYIISGGFKEYIIPVARTLGLESSHVIANTFVFNEKDEIVGYDVNNPLSGSKGKVCILKQKNFPQPIYVVGDGYTDYEIKKEGIAQKFFAFVENVRHEAVIEKADEVVHSMDELIKKFQASSI